VWRWICLVINSVKFFLAYIHFIIVLILIAWQFHLINAGLGIKSIFEKVALLVKLLIDISRLKQVILNKMSRNSSLNSFVERIALLEKWWTGIVKWTFEEIICLSD
jgi:hypothetical protein